jgi:hypothetical protein
LLDLGSCSRRIEEMMRDNRARKVTTRVRSGPRPALRLIVRPPSRWERIRLRLRGRLVRLATSEALLVVITLLLLGALLFNFRRLGWYPAPSDEQAGDLSSLLSS